MSASRPASVPSEEEVFRLLLRTLGLLERVMQPYFARFGITGAQWGVLRVLARAEQAGEPALRLTDLGRRLLIRPASVTEAIGRMEQAGLVRRSPSPTDQRAKQVALSDAGRALLGRVLEGHGEHLRAVMVGLDRPQQAQLYDLLGTLHHHLEKMAEAEGNRDSGASN